MSPTKASIKPGELTPFAIYTCRHTYTTRLLAAGVPNAIVDQLIGHGRRRGDVLRFYSARVMEYLRDAVRDLEELRKTKESAFKIHDAIGTLRHIAKGFRIDPVKLVKPVLHYSFHYKLPLKRPVISSTPSL